MSAHDAKAFVKKMTDDSKFRSKVEGCKDEASRKKLVKDSGFDFTKVELKMIAPGAVHGAINGELSESDLEKVAGGTSASWTGLTVGVAVAAM